MSYLMRAEHVGHQGIEYRKVELRRGGDVMTATPLSARQRHAAEAKETDT